MRNLPLEGENDQRDGIRLRFSLDGRDKIAALFALFLAPRNTKAGEGRAVDEAEFFRCRAGLDVGVELHRTCGIAERQ